MIDGPIRAHRLWKVYRSGSAEVQVLTGLDLEVTPGECVAIVGPSGAGKSTLLHILGGLDRPTQGTVYYGSTDLFQLDDARLAEFRNRHLGFVWQRQSLLGEFTALENVMLPLLIRGLPRQEAERRARRCLAEVELEARAHHRAGELSGGEQQRVALARALAAEPRVLLADEPTGNLDFATAEQVMDLLGEVHRTHRLTSVIVTHNLSFAARCDRILKLEQGVLAPWASEPLASSTAKKDRRIHV